MIQVLRFEQDSFSKLLLFKFTLIFQQCFGYILQNPPAPLTEADIWFQIGHVYELKKDVCFYSISPLHFYYTFISLLQQRNPMKRY